MADKKKQGEGETVTIKKYANRRLYNTATSSYVTLDHLCQMVKDGVEFHVYDAKTGDDITHSVLTQIIVEEESKGQNLLPISFLRMLISFYGDSLQWVLPKYLEHSMSSFSRNQDSMRSYMDKTFGGIFPFGSNLEEMGKQNMAMLDSAMRMFSPFGAEGMANRGSGTAPNAAPGAAKPESPAASDPVVSAMKEQIDNLQHQIEAMVRLQTEAMKAATKQDKE
ncbi:polyhydroxyalkanoate synthesis repressor PhaR [Oceanibaculum indicum]|uniref:Polyhydroxyalkanoate synthesis repressor PhaR n=2 Tax=Oceanibaculum indicum TaxID=526216 RepID=K2K576_9PROT|nr:polyhydroxyalkanoate synthesis repressor PhaR [Oceanibaculum indicum]EKE78084.1 polyhydroxyalkanoate synthesis repressor PhaR [Oceanibaculum indicum P24]RKQ73534.1 polyhydroxyalkanoate synthesis repressor PhaR [Oceanibaculum indicum]